MPHRMISQMIQEIDDLTLLTEKTLAELQRKTEELRALYRKHQGELPNLALLSHPSKKQQPRK